MKEKDKQKLKTNKNISLENKKISPNKISINNNKNTLSKTKLNEQQKNAIKKKLQKRVRENIKLQSNIDRSNFKYTPINSNLKGNNIQLEDTSINEKLSDRNSKLQDISINSKLNDRNSKLEYTSINNKLNNRNIKLQDNLINDKLKNKDIKLTYTKNLKFLKDSQEKSTNQVKVEPSINEFKADIKNLKLAEKKASFEFDKKDLEKKIRKNYVLKFREKEQNIDENGNLNIKNKLIFPKLEQKGFKYKDSLPRKVFYRTDDLIRGKIHSEINKTEDDNTTVKALHTSEKFIERKVINFKRNSNYRNIKKHNKLEKKISKIEPKQTLNSLKVQFKDDKQAYKKAVKDTIKKKNQKNKYQKMMMKNVNKVKFTRRFQNTISNVLTFKFNPLTYLLSFKGILISIVLFFVMILFYLILMIFSSNQGLGNIYEIQKAELYYRELEANNEYSTGTRINHDPIDLASFLTVIFGEFEFNEEIETFLSEEVFSKQEQGKSLEEIVSDFLTPEEYEYYLYLYDIKNGFIKYGSPFDFEYEPYISSYIGYRINPTSAETVLQLHKGLDIAVAGGTEILAISDGIVTRANFSSSFGNIVEILHDDGYTSKYAHQERLNVTKGQRVKQGDTIGFVGTTGDSTGNHLHLELYDEIGEFMNPIYFIARDNERSDNNSN